MATTSGGLCGVLFQKLDQIIEKQTQANNQTTSSWKIKQIQKRKRTQVTRFSESLTMKGRTKGMVSSKGGNMTIDRVWFCWISLFRMRILSTFVW